MTVNITCDLIQLHFEAFGAHRVVKTVENLLIRLDFFETIEVTTNSFGVNFFEFSIFVKSRQGKAIKLGWKKLHIILLNLQSLWSSILF
jgi:hypothetical protein